MVMVMSISWRLFKTLPTQHPWTFLSGARVKAGVRILPETDFLPSPEEDPGLRRHAFPPASLLVSGHLTSLSFI